MGNCWTCNCWVVKKMSFCCMCTLFERDDPDGPCLVLGCPICCLVDCCDGEGCCCCGGTPGKCCPYGCKIQDEYLTPGDGSKDKKKKDAYFG